MTHPNAHIDAPHEPDWRPFTMGGNHDRLFRMCTKCGAIERIPQIAISAASRAVERA